MIIPGKQGEISEPEKARKITTIFDPHTHRYIDIYTEAGWEKTTGGLVVPKKEFRIENRDTVDEEVISRIEAEKSTVPTLAEIEGLDKKRLEFAYQFIRANNPAFTFQQEANLGKLIARYFSQSGDFSTEELPRIEELLKICSLSQAPNAQQIDGNLVNQVINRLNYFLHPDIFELILQNDRRNALLNL